jgi:acyl-CoA thioester hydrolase
MGITHHSNYIRWMEEARTSFFEAIGYPYNEFEKLGAFSPVVSLSCDYRDTTTYCDEIETDVEIIAYNGLRMKVSYVMTKVTDGKIVFRATSDHCFIKQEGGIVRVNRNYPELHEKLLSMIKTAE